MIIDVPVRHADSDEDSDGEALPSIVVAAMENLSVLFSDLHLNDGPRYFGEDFDVEALCASFSRLSIVETHVHDIYPSNILVFDGPPPSVGFFTPYHVAAVSNAVEVMVIGAGTSTAPGKASADVDEPAAATADTLRDAIAGLKTPVAASANPADARASLEEARKRILEEGIAVASAKRQMEATQHEYKSAYGLTPIFEAPSRLGSVRSHGRFIAEVLGGDLPTYETPAANMRAAQAAMEEMASLEGDERAFHQKRVKDLLDAANQQHIRLDPGQAESESPGPNPGARRNPSGQNHAEGSSSHRRADRRGEGSQDRRSLRQSEHTSGLRRRGDEGDSECEILPPRRTNVSGSRGASPLATQVGAHTSQDDRDARRCLIVLAQSALLEEAGPVGLAFFGPRIQGEPFPRGFTLPRATPKYNGTAKPKDWLIDYTTAVGIARGNKRVAVHYVPLMLAGSTWTWHNSLPAGSVNSWEDFEEAFVCNFTDTYKCPSRPRELAMCIQKPDEPLRDYVTRWTELRNSCEGVHEVQAIQYFIEGCRDGTLLKHKLMCSEPTSLAVLMAKAEKYAAADSAMRLKVTASDKAGDNRGGQNKNKCKADQMIHAPTTSW
ncbi:hypothetical protein ZWY2020_004964 [Hordeum vulgare]|nr:hypothetical protein ZWY2020_004964 [Hordeum vulgare]